MEGFQLMKFKRGQRKLERVGAVGRCGISREENPGTPH